MSLFNKTVTFFQMLNKAIGEGSGTPQHLNNLAMTSSGN